MSSPAQIEKTTLLNEVEAKDLLRQAGIPVVPTKLARSKKEALALSREMGFPVALKIVSPDIIHKSDAGGVKLGLANTAQVARAYSGMLASIKQKYPGAEIDGVAVQKMAQLGVEIIIGMSQDSQFGPVIMFGLGGILVEVLKDVSFRVVPLSKRDAAEMVREIKGFTLLQGFRGQPPVNLARLEELLIKVSDFVEKNPRIKELDLNPLFARGDSIVAVDARILLEPA
jgi:acetate---CoA ligase (ADP-forming) subunit beta